ncbi:hypothetical protein JCM19239_7162 [Vibrio variabilis]|uniref:Uncharacterized protein n=1 Tax=Vibrio variabilis TaxID=990271 RepID=A0ABQ0JK22_9VIBR|nr:hypothetical protein JCM19239_7162 [Vibrio variabilis]
MREMDERKQRFERLISKVMNYSPNKLISLHLSNETLYKPKIVS